MTGRELTKQEEALFKAIERKKIDKVRRLLAQGVNANAADWSDYVGNTTALMSAAGCQFPEAVELLLKAGADPNAKRVAGLGGHGGGTALRDAIDGSDPTQPGMSEEDDLKQRMRVVELLLQGGADANAVDEAGISPIYSAATAGYISIIKRLIEADADPHGKDGSLPPLAGAADGGHVEIVRLLLKHGVSVDIATSDGITSLMAAAYRGGEEVVGLLLQHGADPNHRASDGRTPLISAATFARDAFYPGFSRASSAAAHELEERDHQLALRIVKRLIEAGADSTARNKEGRTALDIAGDARSPLVANYLRNVLSASEKKKK